MSAGTDTPSQPRNHDSLDEIQQRISALEDDSANEQVDELLDILAHLTIECKRLDAKNRQYERRLSNLEALEGVSGDELDLGELTAFDSRDKRVLRAIVAEGYDRVSLTEFRSLYRQHTDVRAKDTLTERTRELATNGPFEPIRGKQVWEFTGDFELES